MTLQIELSPDEARRLQNAASKHGLETGELAHKLIVDHLPMIDVEAVAAMLETWRQEDADIPSEEAEAELREFKTQMNANRAGEEPLFL